MTVKIEVVGLKKTKKFLDRKKRNIKFKTNRGLNRAALFMQGEVKESIAGRRNEPTSVDTGRFLNSIDFSVGRLDAVVFSLLEYAKFLEFGTSRFRARRHFRNSKDRNKQNIRSILRKELKKI